MNLMLSLLINIVNPLSLTATKSYRTTTTSSPTAQPERSTGVLGTSASGYTHGRTTGYLATRDVTGPSPESSTTSPVVPSNQPLSSTEPETVTAPTRSPVTSSGEFNCFHMIFMTHGLLVTKYSISDDISKDVMRNAKDAPKEAAVVLINNKKFF